MKRLVVAILMFMLLPAGALADPCGMVPPIRVEAPSPIVRVGLQKTYVAYGEGIETMVLRPGFKGKVGEFGMLIPFPSAPAIRKVDDNIFAHIAAAIDPPEVVAYVPRPVPMSTPSAQSMPMGRLANRGAETALKSKKDQPLRYRVDVVQREAIGMYDVAVLKVESSGAGATAATATAKGAKVMRAWMKSNAFRYPDGMEPVIGEYIHEGWNFVAVKVNVGRKDGVNPRPGMKSLDPGLPSGAGFQGHVQAMGFRFKSDALVVPMRLSTFNEGDLRNVVYVLADNAKAIDSIPKRHIRRQVAGAELYRNVTGPLPLRVYGGTINDLPPAQRKQLVTQRKPDKHNGIARDLFASDLATFRSGQLAHDFEQKEKRVLAISESLGLRDKMDTLHRSALNDKARKATDEALKDLERMTLTVIDGDFPRDVLRKQNLVFVNYEMRGDRNKRQHYDAPRFGPNHANPGGTLYRTSAEPPAERPVRHAGLIWILLAGGVAIAVRRRKGALTMVAVCGCLLLPAVASATAIRDLAEDSGAQTAHRNLVNQGPDIVDDLGDAVVESDDPVLVGRIILVLKDIPGPRSERVLKELHNRRGISPLYATWAAAARVQRVTTLEELKSIAPMGSRFPALMRPLQEVAPTLIGRDTQLETIVELVNDSPALRPVLGRWITTAKPRHLVQIMLRGRNDSVRRLAAGYLAGRTDQDEVANAVVRELRFRPGAIRTPWNGGALFVPGLAWKPNDAKRMVDHLTRWMIFSHLNNDHTSRNQIANNLRSVGLTNRAGLHGNPSHTGQWLKMLAKRRGRPYVREMLNEQEATDHEQFRGVLN